MPVRSTSDQIPTRDATERQDIDLITQLSSS